MTLLVVQNKEVLSMSHLLRVALKFIFDQNNMNFAEEKQMRESILRWKSAIEIEKDKLRTNQSADINIFGKVLSNEHKYMDEEIRLGYISKLLVDDMNGDLDSRKGMFVKHGIDYRKFYRLPEAYVKEDFVKAQDHLSVAKKDNPEDYE